MAVQRVKHLYFILLKILLHLPSHCSFCKTAKTGEYMVTDNPYEISFDPTDGLTRYVDLLGWALPKALALDSCRYQSLSEAVRSMNWQPRLGKETINLQVMKNPDANCVFHTQKMNH